jgi:Kdo2-lipid IVA lauroyltransferase/acyltransferase
MLPYERSESAPRGFEAAISSSRGRCCIVRLAARRKRVLSRDMTKAGRPYPEFLISLCRGSLGWFFRLLPRRARRGLAKSVAWLWFDVIRYRRRLVIDNLGIAFPDWPEDRRTRVGRRSVQHLCHGAIEALLLPFLNARNLHRHAEFHGLEHIEAALARGKGVLLLVSHLGNIELAMAAVSLHGFRLNVIAKFLRNRFLNQLVFGTRERFGTKFIDPHGSRTAFDVLHACRRNELVVFVIDQSMRPQYGVETTFFGRPAGTAYGLALFAIKTAAPVVPVYSYLDQHDMLHIAFEAPEPLRECHDRDEQLRVMTQNYNHRLEAIICRHPEQWMWVHRRWKPFR